MKIYKNNLQKKEKLKKIKEEIAKLEKEIQLSLIKFLVEKGYNNPKNISKIWNLSFGTAQQYIKESINVDFDRRAEPDIEKIKNEKNISWMEAVEIYYKELLRPKCGYGLH